MTHRTKYRHIKSPKQLTPSDIAFLIITSILICLVLVLYLYGTKIIAYWKQRRGELKGCDTQEDNGDVQRIRMSPRIAE